MYPYKICLTCAGFPVAGITCIAGALATVFRICARG